MTKQIWKAGNMIYPLPAVLVSCGDHPENYNIITIAWTGTMNTNPPICYISVRPERHSYQLIKSSGEFVINLTTRSLARATDWCGVKSGRDFDKFKEMELTPAPAEHVSAPLIKESPVNLECKVKQIMELGSHHAFIAEILNIHADERFINPETGKFDLAEANPIAYSHGNYFEMGKKIGKFGFSVEKKKRQKRK